jgi:nucleotide-binding universal stress UspA family protein
VGFGTARTYSWAHQGLFGGPFLSEIERLLTPPGGDVNCENDRARPTVVVGVDGSAASLAAIRWAAGYAQTTGAAVRAVLAWRVPALVGRPAQLASVDYEAAGRRTLEDAVMTGLPERCQVDVEEEVVRGPAPDVLLDAARTADLLVLGGSRHGELAGAVLGSVSLTCVTNAHCPVVVVRT